MNRADINHIKRVTALAAANCPSEKSSTFVRVVMVLATIAATAAGMGMLLKVSGLQ